MLTALSLAYVMQFCVLGAGQHRPPPSTGVLTNKISLEKTTFLEDAQVGDITEIRYAKDGSPSGAVYWIIGKKGAVFTDSGGNIVRRVKFDSRGGAVVSAKSQDSLGITYINRGGGWQPVSVFDNNGHSLWKHGSIFLTPNDMVGGDLNGDGNLEFVVGYNGGGGVGILDHQGKLLRRKGDSNVWHVELVDVNQDGELEILHSNARGQLTLRKLDLTRIKTIKCNSYIGKFCLCEWPAQDETLKVIFRRDGAINIVDLEGKAIQTLRDPLSFKSASSIRGTLVDFGKEVPSALAIYEGIRATWERSLLSI